MSKLSSLEKFDEHFEITEKVLKDIREKRVDQVDYNEKLKKLTEILRNNKLKELEACGKKDLLKDCDLEVMNDGRESDYAIFGFKGKINGATVEVCHTLDSTNPSEEVHEFKGKFNGKSMSSEDAERIFKKYSDIAEFQDSDFETIAKYKLEYLFYQREKVKRDKEREDEERIANMEEKKEENENKEVRKRLIEKGIL